MSANWYRSKAKTSTQSRRHVRKPTRLPALVRSTDGGTLVGRCLIVDMSEGGARLKFEGVPDLPPSFILVLSRDGYAHRHCEVRWRTETEIGVQFVKK